MGSIMYNTKTQSYIFLLILQLSRYFSFSVYCESTNESFIQLATTFWIRMDEFVFIDFDIRFLKLLFNILRVSGWYTLILQITTRFDLWKKKVVHCKSGRCDIAYVLI